MAYMVCYQTFCMLKHPMAALDCHMIVNFFLSKP
uniref:Uncharacterized protein n=1 Tax=Rhizophora mucronata TaxID=61149 RepID=A0A2P2PYP6_RHIMU